MKSKLLSLILSLILCSNLALFASCDKENDPQAQSGLRPNSSLQQVEVEKTPQESQNLSNVEDTSQENNTPIPDDSSEPSDDEPTAPDQETSNVSDQPSAPTPPQEPSEPDKENKNDKTDNGDDHSENHNNNNNNNNNNSDDNENQEDTLTEDEFVFTLNADEISYTLTKYNGSDVSVTIPEVHQNLPVTAVGERAFYDTKIESVKIPDNVTTLGKKAFSDCVFLQSVVIGDGITVFDKEVFLGSCSIKSITLGNGIKVIRENEWNDTLFQNLEQIVLGDSLEEIEKNAFRDLPRLASIEIPASVRIIGREAFYNCSALQTVTFHHGLQAIEPSAFEGCGIVALTLPDSVTDLGERVFSDCLALTEVRFGSGIEKIPTEAFSNCVSLIDVIGSPSATEIGDLAFSNCSALEAFVIPDGIKTIGTSTFESCSSLKNITIPLSLTTIGSGSFESCTSLTSVFVSDLSQWFSFDWQGNPSTNPLSYAQKLYVNGELLTNLIVPETVTEIGDYAFFGYPALVSITLHENIESIGEDAFFGCQTLVEVINHSSVSFSSSTDVNWVIEHTNDKSIIDKENGYLFYTLDGTHYLLGYAGEDPSPTLPLLYKGSPYQIFPYADLPPS